jgi:hypothetical protein
MQFSLELNLLENLPQWRHYREELNRAPLGWEEWEEQE